MIKIVLKSFLVLEQRADFSRGDTSPRHPPLGEPFPFPPNPLPVPAILGRIANNDRQDPPEPTVHLDPRLPTSLLIPHSNAVTNYKSGRNPEPMDCWI